MNDEERALALRGRLKPTVSVHEIILLAFQEERERCAQIAETTSLVRQAIAARIRSGE